jgi:hypothetical protein
MLLDGLTPITVSTTRGGVAKLSNQRACPGRPTQKDQDTHGGIVKYLILLDPVMVVAGTKVLMDTLPGDVLTIQSWTNVPVTTTWPYRVIEADISGGLGLEVMRCLVAEVTDR